MEAFITLATNDSYAIGACTLAYSLRRSGTTRQIVIMITSQVSHDMRRVLDQLFDHVEVVDLLHSGDPAHLELMERQDLGGTFTKLHCWKLTQYSKAVFMDADTLVLKNIDDLFDREEFSAAPDPGWPDCFNSGVFVFRPSLETHGKLLAFAAEHGSFDGADQGLLNRFFSDWATKDIARHLPFLYNCCMWEFYSYLPALREFRPQVRVVHFIGPVKPWHQTAASGHDERTLYRNDFLRQWWGAFAAGVQPRLSPDLVSEEKADCYLRVVEAPVLSHTSVVDGFTRMALKFPEPVAEVAPSSSFPSSESTHFRTTAPEVSGSVAVAVDGTSLKSPEHLSSPISHSGSAEISHSGSAEISHSGSAEISRSTSVDSFPGTGVASVTDVGERSSDVPEATSHVDVEATSERVDEPFEVSPEHHRTAWEHGYIDYLGVDRFENILARLKETLGETKSSIPEVREASTSTTTSELESGFEFVTEP